VRHDLAGTTGLGWTLDELLALPTPPNLWFCDGRDSRPVCERLAEKGVALARAIVSGCPTIARPASDRQPTGSTTR
jgi:hypothetical protein